MIYKALLLVWFTASLSSVKKKDCTEPFSASMFLSAFVYAYLWVYPCLCCSVVFICVFLCICARVHLRVLLCAFIYVCMCNCVVIFLCIISSLSLCAHHSHLSVWHSPVLYQNLRKTVATFIVRVLRGGDKNQGYLPREAVVSQEAAWNCRGVMVVMAAAGGQADHRLAREGQVLRDSWRQPPTCSFRPVANDVWLLLKLTLTPLSLYIYTHTQGYTHTQATYTHIPPIHLITTYMHTEHDHMCVQNRSTNQR